MKVGVAQTRPVKGDIQRNIDNHKKLIDLAVAAHADVLFFPELSLTGYEPELVNDLATNAEDSRLNEFQTISDKHAITIGAGMPTRSERGIHISMIIFQPHQPRQTYSKQYLHSDEFPYFVNGEKAVFLSQGTNTIAPAICYELSIPAHAADAHAHHADIYIASVAEHANGVEKSGKKLPAIAAQYGMTVLRANLLGLNDNFYSVGQSAIWNNKGELVGQLNDTDEGILLIDTETMEVFNKQV